MNDNHEAILLEMSGDRPFTTLIVTDVDLSVGDVLSRIDLTTIDGCCVQVPITRAALVGLHEVIGRALGEVVERPREETR